MHSVQGSSPYVALLLVLLLRVLTHSSVAISPAPVESKSSECLHAPTVELKYLLTVEEYLAYHSPPTGSAGQSSRSSSSPFSY